MYWNPVEISYNPKYLMISSQVQPIQLKVKLILTTAIALDRDIVSTILHLTTILCFFQLARLWLQDAN